LGEAAQVLVGVGVGGAGGAVACAAVLAAGSGGLVAAGVGLASTATACPRLGVAVVPGDGASAATGGEGDAVRWPPTATAATPRTTASAEAVAAMAAVLRALGDRSLGRSPQGRVPEVAGAGER
jgi:hypothetical protein